MKKHKLLLLWLVIGCGLLTSCTGKFGMKHQSFVTAMGIEIQDEAVIEVSILDLPSEPKQSSSNEGEENEDMMRSRILSEQCEVFSACMERLRSNLSGRFIMDKIEYIVFHETVLQLGLVDMMEYLFHIGNVEQTVKLFSTTQPIHTFLTNEGGITLTGVMDGMQFNPSLIPVEMWEFAPLLYTNLQHGMFSSLSIVEDDSDEGLEETLHVEGIDFLHKDKVVMKLPLQDVEWVHLFFKQKKYDLMYILENDKLAYRIRRHRVQFKVTEERVDIHIYIKGWLMTNNKDILDNNERLESNISKQMEQKLQQIIDETKLAGVDFIGIGEKFRTKNYPTQNWHDKIKKLPIHVHVNTKVLSGYGVTNSSL